MGSPLGLVPVGLGCENANQVKGNQQRQELVERQEREIRVSDERTEMAINNPGQPHHRHCQSPAQPSPVLSWLRSRVLKRIQQGNSEQTVTTKQMTLGSDETRLADETSTVMVRADEPQATRCHRDPRPALARRSCPTSGNRWRRKEENKKNSENSFPINSHLSSSAFSQYGTNKPPTSSLPLLLLVVSLLSLCFVVILLGESIIITSYAYQLTNNLIANNLPPKFTNSPSALANTQSEIVVRVKEGPQSINKLIYTLKGEDPDDDPLTFGVLGSMASDLLRIENVPGNQANVYLRKELDRETTESHQIVITLTDGKLGRGNWITKSMLIIVEDVNDNYPVFHPHRTAISVREDARAPFLIETVEASDADEGRFGQVIYKLDELTTGANDESPSSSSSAQTKAAHSSSASISSIFAIETIDGRGVISLIGQLDYEQRQLYQLRVLAIDRAAEHERLSTSTSIMISVEDCEDQPPMFTFAPSITRIPEDLPIGSPILRLAAIDGDRGVNNPIKYSLVSVNSQESGHERNLFTINSDTGQISVARQLDREYVAATSTPNLESAASSNDWLTGFLGSQSDQKRSFSAANNNPGAYVLQVKASEVASSAESSVTTELTVILTDVNDEAPQFSQSQYFGELLENSPGESLVTFVAGPFLNSPLPATTTTTQAPTAQLETLAARVFDRDQGTNGTFLLHLEGEHSQLFELWPREATNEANLMLKVSNTALMQNAAISKYLDFERTKELRLVLVASEKYPASAKQHIARAEMTIQLKDANDNYPQFESELYRVEIPENAQRGMHICAVKASDLDSGPFGTAGIRFTEIRGERANKFKLDPVTGAITLKTNDHAFDRETIGQHHLIVEARDNLGLGNRNTTQLLIVLTDINDQRPKFLLDQYEAFIYENELDFQSPLQVQATDNDAPNTPNSRLIYSIVAGDPQHNFTIDQQTGRIRVRNTLLAMEKKQPSSGISEGLDIITADGASRQNEIAAGLDFERIAQKRDETRQFNLTIKASDSGAPESLWDTTQVLVLVYDKNDHAPVFGKPLYSKSLREDAREGSPVIQVLAQDDDHSPTNSKITYRISSGASDKFVIDSESGLISVASGANLDIDRAANNANSGPQKRTNYLLNVLASDGSFGPNQKSSSCLVNITLIDVNNKPPEFVSLGASSSQANGAKSASTTTTTTTTATTTTTSSTTAHVYVNEDAPYGLIVTRVFATDLDSSAELRYSINYAKSEARNEEMSLVEPSLYRDCFTIDQQDGTIKVSKQLDRELFDQVKLRLQVEDLAAQTADQVAYTYLLVKITDVNDNRPMFKRPLYKAVVNENSISGTSVITMQADDRDLNKTLKYSLEASSNEIMRLIRINPRSGEITVNDKIDRELFASINVTVRAEDSGQPNSLSGTAQLSITVRDENDNNPVFLNATTTTSSHHSSSARARSANLQPANHNNNNFASTSTQASTYRLRSLGPPLGLTSMSAAETEASTLDPTMPTSTDATALMAAGSSSIDLAMSSQLLPLLGPGSSARVREDAPIGHQVAYVRAEDADLGNNGRVTYLLDSQTSVGKFRIDRDSGVITVASPLDREQQKQFNLIIEACDNFDLGYSTGESRRAFTQVTIYIGDVNDNAPVISTNLHQIQLSSPGLELQQQQGANNKLTHSLVRHLFQAGGSAATASYPSYDEAMAAQGPLDLPLAECLFINEFQALNEPVLTLTAIDLDDPGTLNGQVDVAIINNLPQNELFSLAPISQHWSSTTTTTTTSKPLSSSTTTSANNLEAGLNSRNDPQSSEHHQQWHLIVAQSLKEKVGNYSILLRATDRGQPVSLSSVKIINVCVQDVNNHAPEFVRPALNHTIRIMENATIGSFVTQVEATDQDHGHNGELHYSLKQTSLASASLSGPNSFLTSQQQTNLDWQSFKIDRLTGVISTSRHFNRQFKKYYTLRVQAQDLGRPTSLSSDIDINIMIVNSGSYQPEFEPNQQEQSLQFTENLAPGLDWFTLVQTSNLDDDPALINANNNQNQSSLAHSGSGYRLAASSPCYFILDGDDREQMFVLDKYTHRLTNQKSLDREKKSNYTLIVQASNSCHQKQSLMTISTDSLSSLSQQSTEPSKGHTRSARSLSAGPKQAAEALILQPGISQEAQWQARLNQDRSLLRVSIKIKDVNDNAPRFTQKIYTGGITTEADFGTVFMIVQAIDLDADTNGQVTYSIIKPIRRNLMLPGGSSSGTISGLSPGASLSLNRTGLSNNGAQRRRLSKRESQELVTTTTGRTTSTPSSELLMSTLNNNLELLAGDSIDGAGETGDSDELFVINQTTGEISLNFDPQKHMKGYFEFEIGARDAEGLTDSARVFIYLLRQDQRVKFVLRLTPSELRQRLNKFRSVFGNITGAIVNIDSYKYFENHDGTVDKKKTSLYLHFVQPEDNTIIDVDKVLTLIDNNIEYLDELYKEFHVLSSEAAHLPLGTGVGGALVDPIDQVRTGLLGISSFLALILILVIALCLNQRTRYERQLKAATVSAFGSAPLRLSDDFHSQTNLPNTNLHSQDPNPIWVQQRAAAVSGGRSGGGGNGQYGLTRGLGQDEHHSAAAQLDWLVVGSDSPPANKHHNHNHNHQQTNKQARPGSRMSTLTAGVGGALQVQADLAGGGRPLRQQASNNLNSRSNKQPKGLTSARQLRLDDDEEEEDDDGLDLDLSSPVSSSPSGSSSGVRTLARGMLSHHQNNNNNNNNQQQQHHFNVATTATPRDSLNSSHGQVSSASTSGSGSASTTNERQALCGAGSGKTSSGPRKDQHQAGTLSRRIAAEQQQNKTFGVQSGKPMLLGSQAKSNLGASDQGSTFGTSGAFKEVTIYTDHQASIRQQKGAGMMSAAATTTVYNSKQSGVKPSLVKATANQLNQKSIFVQQQQHQPPFLTTNKQRILIHSSGADVNQGIIKQHQQQQQLGPATKLQTNAKYSVPRNNQQASSTAQQQPQAVLNQFECTLSKLSILNLETTEL